MSEMTASHLVDLLHAAIATGDDDAVAAYVAAGADLSARRGAEMLPGKKDHAGVNAYHLAAQQGAGILRLLLDAPVQKGFFESFEEGDEVFDLIRLALKNRDADVLDLLVNHGFPLNAKGGDGLVPLQFLVKRVGGGDAAFDMLVTLCRAGADINGLATKGGDTPLMMLARNGWARAFDYLLEQGLDYATPTANGDTLLHAAALGPSAEVMARTLALGINVNARNRQGKTAFYIAAHRNRTQHIDLLLSAGADPTIADLKGRTPAMVCQGPLQQRTQNKVSRAQRDWQEASRKRGPDKNRPDKNRSDKKQVIYRGRKR